MEKLTITEHLKKFDKIYKDIKTLPKKEVYLTDLQKENIKNDLKYFLENLEEKIIFRSDYKSLLTILKNIQFYSYMNDIEEEL